MITVFELVKLVVRYAIVWLGLYLILAASLIYLLNMFPLGK